jgi:hypothetical protein
MKISSLGEACIHASISRAHEPPWTQRARVSSHDFRMIIYYVAHKVSPDKIFFGFSASFPRQVGTPYRPSGFLLVWPPMRILLRNPSTDRYYAGAGQWVSDAALAIDFREPSAAAEFVSTAGTPAEIALGYDRAGLNSRFSRQWVRGRSAGVLARFACPD